NYKGHFTAVIFAKDFARFPPNPERYYLNKTVRVTGKIQEYGNKPEIIVKDPSQVEIIGE
ncbi:MAG: thermonuclease family protein, partial [Candidatus Omnitrophica bacterium]|nr:thermonuclease family protein [Candidatus Omnitrophota bacterium]